MQNCKKSSASSCPLGDSPEVDKHGQTPLPVPFFDCLKTFGGDKRDRTADLLTASCFHRNGLSNS